MPLNQMRLVYSAMRKCVINVIKVVGKPAVDQSEGMMYTHCAISLLFLAALLECTTKPPFKCPKNCSLVMCIAPNLLMEQCGEAGTALGPCNCCLQCAKKRDDLCGGNMNVYGTCGHGLTCYKKSGDVGTCQPIPKTPNERILDKTTGADIVFGRCKPKCTYEFCSKRPYAACSASSNAVKTRNCQSKCQHTNCQACYFKTKRESPCPKCKQDDFQCMEEFGKCIHHETCSRHKYPCQPRKRRQNDGRFVCKVPACLY